VRQERVEDEEVARVHPDERRLEAGQVRAVGVAILGLRGNPRLERIDLTGGLNYSNCPIASSLHTILRL
jgi:hypothetical protein